MSPKRQLNTDDAELIQSLISTMIAKTPVAYIILDKDFKVHFMNDYFVEMRKMNRAEVLGGYCYDISNRGIPCSQCSVREAIRTGERHVITRKDILHDGSIRYIDDYAVPLYKPDGTFDYILEMMINRTEELTARDESDRLFLEMVNTLITVLDKKDAYTSSHSRAVAAVSTKLAEFLQLDQEEIFRVTLGALVHDMGKIYVPDGIINKNGKLTDDEYRAIQAHPKASFELVKELRQFQGISEAARHHHERWDGKGYPDKLAGEDIPLIARIIAIADTYDAMTSTRSYRKALPHEVAIEEIRKNAGSQFDPCLAEKFIEMATISYGSRELLADETSTSSGVKPRSHKIQVERQLVATDSRATGKVDSESISSLMSDEGFAQEIFRYTPAYYAIIDEAFNIVYASDSMVRDLGMPMQELLKKRCFEINDKNMSCFALEGGSIKCPVVRALQTNSDQTGKVTEIFKGMKMHFDIFAVPMELPDKNGKKFRCAMEILVDRTEEVNSRLAKEDDIKTLLNTLYDLVRRVDTDTTMRSADIFQECANFGEYLTSMSFEMNKLSHDEEREKIEIW